VIVILPFRALPARLEKALQQHLVDAPLQVQVLSLELERWRALSH
jgi:hypothetical protein